MANVVRHLHRLAGGSGAGSPATVASSGVISINFDVGAGTPELWASDGAAWKQLNPSGTYATSAEIIAGTDTTKMFNAAVMAGASVLGVSAGAGDASKYVRLDANGLLNTSLFGTNAVASSAGAADAGKFVKLDLNGLIDISMLDTATAAEISGNAGSGTVNGLVTDDKLAAASVKTFGSTADDGKYVRVTSTGKISPTLLPTSTMEFLGSIDPTAAANVPGAPDTGDVYVISTAGVIDAGFTGAAGKTGAVGDQLIYDGTNWTLIQTANPDLSGYLPLAGTAGVTGAAMASGAIIKMAPAAAGNVVFDAATGAIDNAVIDCGTF